MESRLGAGFFSRFKNDFIKIGLLYENEEKPD